MAHANMTSRYIQYHFGNEEGIKAGRAISFGKFSHLVLESDQTTDTAGKNNTYPVGVDIVFIQSCVDHSLVTGHECELGKAVDFSCFFLIEVLNGVKIFDFAGKLRTKLT